MTIVTTDEYSFIHTAPLNLQHASGIQLAVDVDECNGGLGTYAAYVVDDVEGHEVAEMIDQERLDHLINPSYA